MSPATCTHSIKHSGFHLLLGNTTHTMPQQNSLPALHKLSHSAVTAFGKLSALPEAGGSSRAVWFLLPTCSPSATTKPRLQRTEPRSPSLFCRPPAHPFLLSAGASQAPSITPSIHPSPLLRAPSPPPSPQLRRPGAACHCPGFPAPAQLTPFIKQRLSLSRSTLGCTVSLFLFRYSSRSNLDEII